MAWVYSDQVGTIFVSEEYFKMDQIDRALTLIHESSHHVYGYEHTTCETKEYISSECDDDLSSPYGEEYKAIEYLWETKKINKEFYRERRHAVLHRVNSLIKSL